MDPFNILDTKVGDRVLDAAAVAELLAGTPQPDTFTNITATGTLQVDGLASLVGGLLLGGLEKVTVTNGITAGTTHTLAGAVALTTQINVVATVGTSADAVALPTASPGLAIVIFNDGANPIAVWPQAADKVDGGTAGAAVTLTNAKRCIFYANALNNWLSAQLGAVTG